MRRKLLPLLAFFIILTAGSALRLHNIGAQSLWADEGLTAREVAMPVSEMLHFISIFEQTPPLFYLLEKPWTLLFGNSETILRLPSAIYGIASIALIFLLARRLFDNTAALVAAALLAFSPWHIAYSQEARAYSLLLLLTLISCWFFVRLLEEPPAARAGWELLIASAVFAAPLLSLDLAHGPIVRFTLLIEIGALYLFARLLLRRDSRLLTLYVLASAALLYTHLYGLFTLAAQGIAFLIARRRTGQKWQPWIAAALAVALCYAPYLPVIRGWLRIVNTYFWVQRVTLDDIARSYELYTGSSLLLCILIALTVVAVARRRSHTTLLLGVMLFPIVIPVIVSILTKPTFSPRYGMGASVGLFILAGAGVSAFRSTALRAILLIAIIAIAFFPTETPAPKPQWREAGQYLTQTIRPGDYASINRKGATNQYDYYVHRPDIRRIGFDGSALPVTQPLDDVKRIWLILYTCDYPPRLLIQRGNWRVLRQKMFREVLIFELADPL